MSCGGDGLLKLWDVRSGECTASFEEQEGKVWALTGSGLQDQLLASGGADSAVVLWRDASKEKAEEADSAKALETSLKQDFSNALQVSMLSISCPSFPCLSQSVEAHSSMLSLNFGLQVPYLGCWLQEGKMTRSAAILQPSLFCS